ncbi:MAG: acyl-ACP--UDP-N-acetylglucosamine O-acyltransferase [Verrucomicrobiales bacterium]|nr:acyl-ACP--UDP-N-acetylglucosamine O-acyltransferase [Verrucomicrobiales bacterium]
MPSNIHPTAIVSPTADIADDVTIGAFTIVEGDVTIGSGCKLHSHVHLLGKVTLGENCTLWPGCIIGGAPQSVGFDENTSSGITIGIGNTIREHVTIHRSLEKGGLTRIGDHNFLMVGTHIGHDCVLGDHNVIANNTMLGGHISLGHHIFIGGGTGIHQFARIGDHAMLQGHASISQDIPPYVTAAGLNNIVGLNSIGLRRAGFTPATRREIKQIYRLFYRQELNRQQALQAAEATEWSEAAKLFITFLSQNSKLGYCMRTR